MATGDEFLDHLLELVARHARFDLTIAIGDAREACGDRVVESIAGALGRALRDALGAEQGIRRSGSATMPFDEALALVALDLSGRPYLAYDIDLAGVRIEAFDADLAGRFLRALADAAGITLHVGCCRAATRRTSSTPSLWASARRCARPASRSADGRAAPCAPTRRPPGAPGAARLRRDPARRRAGAP